MIIHHNKISKTIPDLKIKMERKKHEEEEKENRKMELKRVKMKESLVWNDRSFVWNHFIQDAVKLTTAGYAVIVVKFITEIDLIDSTSCCIMQTN